MRDAGVDLARVRPVLEAVRLAFPQVLLSIDTTKSAVARQAIDAGADIVNDVSGFRLDPGMGEVVSATKASGVERQAIVLDPGVGFAKRSEHSLRVLAELRRIIALGFPVMVGVTRKRFIGE